MTTHNEEPRYTKNERTSNSIDQVLSIVMLPLLTFSLALLFFFDPTII